MMFRKTAALFLILSLLVTAFAQEITLQVMSTTIVENPEGTVEQAIADAFMAENPDIKIEFVGTPMNNIHARLTTLAIGGEVPDVFTHNPEFIAAAYDLGLTADLNELFSEEFLSGFYESALNEATFEGELQFLPWFTTPMGLLYRADWFEEAGLEAPQTWDDFLNAAKTLTQDTDGDGQVDRWGFAMVGTKNGSGFARYAQIMHTFGAQEVRKDENGNWVTDLDSPEGIQALDFFTSLVTEHGVVPPGPTETGYGEAVSLMASEKTAMMVTGPHTIGAILAQNPDLDGKIHSVAIPMGQERSASLGLLGFAISSSSENKEAAAKYLEFLVNTENLLEWNRVTGRMPARVEAGEQPQISGPVYTGFVDAINYAQPVPTTSFYTQLTDVVGEAFQSVMVGGVSAEDAAMQAAEQTRSIIADSE